MIVTADQERQIKEQSSGIDLAEYLTLVQHQPKENERAQAQLIAKYFESRPNVDVAVLLHGALPFMGVLEAYLSKTNILFFRPQHTYK